MIHKGDKIYSVIKGVCPRCHQQNMYRISNPFVLTDTLTMNDRCGHCDLKYKMEPSFFFGAMYVSYGVGVAFAIAIFVISVLIFKTSLITSFFWISGLLFLTLPIILRVSRNIWINFFVNYDPGAVSKNR